jgi:hypothetical protein
MIHHEITSIRSMLLRNSYPSWFLDKTIKHTLSNLITNNVKFGPQKERVYIGLNFLGKSSDNIRRSLLKICKQFIPHKDIIVYFKPGCRVSNFFRIKDVTPFELRSRVVYEYTCGQCHMTYIGETSRHLRHRVAEHQGLSHLTLKPVTRLVHSSIRDHYQRCAGSDCSLSNLSQSTRYWQQRTWTPYQRASPHWTKEAATQQQRRVIRTITYIDSI